MLNPIVGTEMDLRSSLFLKKFTIVDLPELLRPMIRMLICFGFLSLFKIFINIFPKTIFRLSHFSSHFSGVFICSPQENSLLCFDENIKRKIEVANVRNDSLHIITSFHSRWTLSFHDLQKQFPDFEGILLWLNVKLPLFTLEGKPTWKRANWFNKAFARSPWKLLETTIDKLRLESNVEA